MTANEGGMGMTSITQADRDAAAQFSAALARLTVKNPQIAACIRGEQDDTLVVQAFARHREAALTTAQAEAEALRAEVERLREALVMAVAEMMRASGRLEVIAGCNEDRRIAAALSGTCDFARAALSEPMP
jgi:hypothetical protein